MKPITEVKFAFPSGMIYHHVPGKCLGFIELHLHGVPELGQGAEPGGQNADYSCRKCHDDGSGPACMSELVAHEI